ncbi:MAG: hypothetical protein ACYCO9_04280 [Streptosporangiaceae bacterium]
MRLRPPICGLAPAGKVAAGSLVTLVIANPATKAAFDSRIKYYQSTKFRVDVRSFSYGKMAYVTARHSNTLSQNLTLYAHGHEYEVIVGVLATKPFTEAQLLHAARLLAGM